MELPEDIHENGRSKKEKLKKGCKRIAEAEH